MSMPAEPVVIWDELTPSSKSAFQWAFTRAKKRDEEESEEMFKLESLEVPPNEAIVEIRPDDLLVGILLAHRDHSEPQQLLEYYKITVDQLYRRLKAKGGFVPGDQPGTRESLADIPQLQGQSEHAAGTGRELAPVNEKGEKVIRLRDLFGGIFLTQNDASAMLHECLADIPHDFAELTKSYSDFLALRSDEMSYAEFLSENFPLPADYHGPEELRFAVSGFSADTAAERDLIGIGAEVDAFAYLLAAKSLKPPLAVGLFGDWGSGKSFFMEALRKRIFKITEDARSSKRPQKEIAIYKHVAQIEFNAWHYVEGELWASLVDHIFQNLHTRANPEPSRLQKTQQHYISKIESARRERRVIRDEITVLSNSLQENKDRVERLKRERNEARKELDEVKARDFWKAITSSLGEDKVAEINNSLHDLGVPKHYDYGTAAELVKATDDLYKALLQGNALITPMLRKNGWLWTFALIVAVLAGPAVYYLLTSKWDAESINSALAGASTTIGAVTIMTKMGTGWLSSALSTVENAQITLETTRIEVEQEYQREIDAATQKLEQTEVEYNAAVTAEAELEAQIARYEHELQQITPGRVLFDFIKERMESQDYRKYLGIAALIRNDFDELSKLIKDENKEFVENDDGSPRGDERYLVNRIILYIDDLDRCPPERVVEVLQAVHLLLAFELFVVVVAVDARWLAQSLQTEYKDLLINGSGGPADELPPGFSRQATPQDYLEKIFQVPFWIRPLPEKAKRRIVQDLVGESLVYKESAGKRGGENGKDGSQNGHSARLKWEPNEKVRQIDFEIDTNYEPESLEVQEIELAFMSDLRGILGETPRSVKRFVNVYRLIKAVSLNSVDHFVTDDSQANYRLVLFLLSVLTGLPAISTEFFQRLRAGRIPSRVQEGPDPQEPYTLQEAAVDLRRSYEVDARGESVAVDPAVQHDLGRLDGWINGFENGSWKILDTALLLDWMPRVVRYSYRMEESY